MAASTPEPLGYDNVALPFLGLLFVGTVALVVSALEKLHKRLKVSVLLRDEVLFSKR